MSQKVIGEEFFTSKRVITADVCGVCGDEIPDYTGFYGWDATVDFHWYQKCPDSISRGWRLEHICPSCSDKIREFVESLGAKISEPYEGVLTEAKEHYGEWRKGAR